MKVLRECDSAQEVRSRAAGLDAEQFLKMLHPDQWEVVCGEYLRDQIGFRFLLLDSGRTLKDFDLIGVDLRYLNSDNYVEKSSFLDAYTPNQADIQISQDKGALIKLDTAPQLSDVVRVLNSLGATPQDLLAILQAIKASGAMNAELEVI